MKRPLMFLASLALFFAPSALAQSVRSLGMGGAGAAGANPAYAALPGAEGGFALPLPLGALNVLLSDRLDLGGENFDLLSAFDQGTHLGTFLFNPARSPDELVASVRSENGVPTLTLETVGGAALLVTRGAQAGYRRRLELPFGFDLGPVQMAVRPYVHLRGRLVPDEGFAAIFGAGSSRGGLSLAAHGEAGVALDLLYAAALPLAQTEDFPAEVYVGVRVSPFLGLARLDAAAAVTVAAARNPGGELEVAYGYQGSGFGALVTRGGLGYGLRGDVGVALAMSMPQGRLTAGLSVQDVGVSFWYGDKVSVAGSGEGGQSASEPVPARRTYVAEDAGVAASLAYDLETAGLGVPGLGSLLVAADASYRGGALGAHLGGEAGFDAGFGEVLVRAGLGYDGGPVLGAGAGLRLPGAGFDLALHGYRSPFTAHQAFGVSAGVVFGP